MNLGTVCQCEVVSWWINESALFEIDDTPCRHIIPYRSSARRGLFTGLTTCRDCRSLFSLSANSKTIYMRPHTFFSYIFPTMVSVADHRATSFFSYTHFWSAGIRLVWQALILIFDIVDYLLPNSAIKSPWTFNLRLVWFFLFCFKLFFCLFFLQWTVNVHTKYWKWVEKNTRKLSFWYIFWRYS